MVNAILTIDDGPSPSTRVLADYLADLGIKSMMFVRRQGDEARPDGMVDGQGNRIQGFDDMVHAARRGHIICPHADMHVPCATRGESDDDIVTAWREDFERVEAEVQAVYQEAGVERPGKFYRFPYQERGDGHRAEKAFGKIIQAVAGGAGENYDLGARHPVVERLQNYLRESGFYQPFGEVDHPLYKVADIRDAADCWFTLTINDWMLNGRYLDEEKEGGYPHKKVSDLRTAFNEDPFIWGGRYKGPHILLMHDMPELLVPRSDIGAPGDLGVFQALIEHMQSRGVEFLDPVQQAPVSPAAGADNEEPAKQALIPNA